MARHKITPTERAPEITEAMRRASNKLSPPTAEALFGDQTKATKAPKNTGKTILPTPRGSQDRATSEPINAKRKPAPGNAVTSPQPASTNGDIPTNGSPNTATPPSILESESNGPIAESTMNRRPAKRQKIAEPTPPARRSTRIVRQPTDSTPTSTRSSPARQIKKKPAKQAKQPSKPKPSPRAHIDENLEAITLAPQESSAEMLPNKPLPASEDSLESHSLMSPSTTASPHIATDVQPNGAGFPLPIRDTVALQAPNTTPQFAQQAPQTQVPIFLNAQTREPVLPTQPLIPWASNQFLPYISRPEDCLVAPNGTLWVPVDPDTVAMMSQMGQMVMLPPDYSHIPRPQIMTGDTVDTQPSSTKGQKVKGRPKPKNISTIPQPNEEMPDSNNDIPSANPRPVANTYPRKQPFKSQVDFPGYPDSNTPVPDEYSLWEMCQRLPNCLREENLKDFIQHDWSANELCACLQEPARQVLNNRAGKDKTMVFQKRLERLRRDLQAKGEYEALMAAPKARLDGRPPWVKRGNIRRK